MPQVHGLLETAIYVHDLNRAVEFYQRVFQFPTLLESPRLIALDVAGRNVLLLFLAGETTNPFETPGGIIPGHGGSGPDHFAFSISAQELQPWRLHLESQRIAVESQVNWPGGAQSLYFRDPDDNLVELITPGFWRIY